MYQLTVFQHRKWRGKERKVKLKLKSGHFAQYFEKNREVAKCSFGEKQTKDCKLKMFGNDLYIHISYTNKDREFQNASIKYGEFQEFCSQRLTDASVKYGATIFRF